MSRSALIVMARGVICVGSLCGVLKAQTATADATTTEAPAASPVPAERTDPQAQVLPAIITPSALPPGGVIKVQFNWQADGPLQHRDLVFVHFIGSHGVAWTDNHNPDVATNSPDWKGKVSYARSIRLPATLPPGLYQVAVGFYPPEDKDQSDIKALAPGEGVTRLSWAPFYVVGRVTVDPSAPLPKADTEGPKSLDLSGYKRVFNEEFDRPLDISPWGPGTRWIAHTPWNGDFGDAKFDDPSKDFPFTINDGTLRIEARKDLTGDKFNRAWRAGLLCSCDPEGDGFSQKYGYFECRARMPAGAGVWPAFWLASQPPPAAAGADVRANNNWDGWMKRFDDAKQADLEIDVIEFYGHDPASYNSTVTVWWPEPHHSTMSPVYTKSHEVSDSFHNYGVMVDPDFITMYFDGVAVWKTKTPREHERPLMMLVNLGLGGGWPIDKVPNPSYMDVKYVRAYAKKAP